MECSSIELKASERCSNENLTTPRSESEILSSSNMIVFTLKELTEATGNFRFDNIIGLEIFGEVFKGWIDGHTFAPSKPGTGMAVTIKRFIPGRGHGHDHKEWPAEINYLGQLHHPNLVKLIGYCSEGDNRLLVYEFMQNRNLDYYLFRRTMAPLSWAPLSWDRRLKIAIGAAKGISYMHDAESHIYGDINSSNILLDSDFNCKLLDFGLAKNIPAGDNTTVSVFLGGSLGFGAPEYSETGRLSAKTDIYSFGVLLLELVSGRRALMLEKPENPRLLVHWAEHLANKGKFLQIMDNKLGAQYPKKGARTMITLALQCTSREPTLRPRISKVLETLEQIRDSNNH